MLVSLFPFHTSPQVSVASQRIRARQIAGAHAAIHPSITARTPGNPQQTKGTAQQSTKVCLYDKVEDHREQYSLSRGKVSLLGDDDDDDDKIESTAVTKVEELLYSYLSESVYICDMASVFP